jgi:hypothetical protein
MKSSYYLRNNVALAIGVVNTILRTGKSISMAELSLLLPFLFDEKIVNALLDRHKYLTIGSLITMNRIALANFNDRYLSLLPLVYQSLSIMLDVKAITISEGVIYAKDLHPFNEMIAESESNLLQMICDASLQLFNMFERVRLSDMYKTLKIEL